MNRTSIEWVKNPDGSQGYTWNPITGCLNHRDGLCNGGGFPCYAYRLAHGRLRERYLANENIPMYPDGDFDRVAVRGFSDPFYPRFWPERLVQPLERSTPSGIFVCDMGELFGNWVPSDWQQHVYRIINECPQHRFYTLTKQAQNLQKFSPFPDNCWVGVTVTANGFMTNAMTRLANVEAPVTFISFEPLLGQIGFDDHMTMKGIVDWVIVGAQTKPYKPPRVEWVQEVVAAADRAGCAVFLKDNLWPLFRDWTLPQWARMHRDHPLQLQLRQEMPQEGE